RRAPQLSGAARRPRLRPSSSRTNALPCVSCRLVTSAWLAPASMRSSSLMRSGRRRGVAVSRRSTRRGRGRRLDAWPARVDQDVVHAAIRDEDVVPAVLVPELDEAAGQARPDPPRQGAARTERVLVLGDRNPQASRRDADNHAAGGGLALDGARNYDPTRLAAEGTV